MTEDYNDRIREHARLILLEALGKQVDERLNSAFLQEDLREQGIDRSRAWIHDELQWLADMGAVTLLQAGSVVVATLAGKGARHLRRAIVIEGVRRPSRPGE